MKWVSPCFLLVACFFCYRSPAQKIKLQRLSVEDGLSQNTVNCILQDSRGFMWFGTQNGLNRYDGNSCVIFRNVADESSTLASNDILSAYEDAHHNLWFGTNAGLSLYNRKLQTFQNFDPTPNARYTMRPVWCISGSAQDDNLWIGASGGLFSFNTSTRKFKNFIINDSIQDANSIRTISAGTNNDLWIGTYYGDVYRFDKTSSTFTIANAEVGIDTRNGGILCIIQDSNGIIWIGREDGLLIEYDQKKKSFIHHRELQDKFPINALRETKDGQLWIGTDKGGTFHFDNKTKKIQPLTNESESGTDVILSYCNDAQGNMWLGTFHGGAWLFDKMDSSFNHILPYEEIKSADENNSVLSLYEDKSGLWMGTDGGGLVRKKGSDKQIFKNIPQKNSIAGNTILCLASHGNLLYAGTYSDGMSVLDKSTGKFTNFSVENGLNDNSVWAIYPDGDYVWIGTNKGGLNLFNARRKTFRYFTNTLKDEHSVSANAIRCFLKDSRGKLWIGTVSGLNVFNDGDSTFTVLSGNNLNNINIRCIYEDSKKNLWVGTYGGGISRFDYHSNKFISYEEKDGLAGNIVLGILEDAQGNLWLSTNKGICKFDPERKAFKTFDARSGMTAAEFNVGASCKGSSGQMYFGSTDGVCSFFPYNIRENNFIPPVVITDFSLFNKPVGIGGTSPLKASITETKEIVLDYSQSVFSFKFASLNYTHPEKNCFAYKLEPFDKEWNEVGNTHTATYTNLDAGRYIFKVKGSNNDKVWNDEAASVVIIVKPPFWRTLWFRVSLLVLVAGLTTVFYVAKVNSIKKQKEILTVLVRQRTAEIEEKNKLLLETEMKNAQLIHQQLNDELALKSKELTNYTLLIIQKNRLLDDLKRKLKEAVRNPGSGNLRDFKNLLKLINHNFNPEKEWTEFNANFNRIHHGFAEQLKARFSELTNNDLRLCALYRIGIPTKDIAEAMGISQTSVKMARYRLRKKLGLTPDEDISEFLKSIG